MDIDPRLRTLCVQDGSIVWLCSWAANCTCWRVGPDLCLLNFSRARGLNGGPAIGRIGGKEPRGSISLDTECQLDRVAVEAFKSVFGGPMSAFMETRFVSSPTRHWRKPAREDCDGRITHWASWFPRPCSAACVRAFSVFRPVAFLAGCVLLHRYATRVTLRV